jgi:hypothetical protein
VGGMNFWKIPKIFPLGNNVLMILIENLPSA